MFPVFVFSQNVEVEGGIIVDSIGVRLGLIKNIVDLIDVQDVVTKE